MFEIEGRVFGHGRRKCMDHLEKTGRIEKQYLTPMVEGKQWMIEAPLEWRLRQ